MRWKERLGFFSLAVVLSLALFAMISIFTDAFSQLFFAFLEEDKKPGVIWVENRIEKAAQKKKKIIPRKDSKPFVY